MHGGGVLRAEHRRRVVKQGSEKPSRVLDQLVRARSLCRLVPVVGIQLPAGVLEMLADVAVRAAQGFCDLLIALVLQDQKENLLFAR